MIALRIELLSGRYVATAYNDRSRAEWPPHPARVFSALVAALHSRPEVRADERAALQWLERQGAPTIVASMERGSRTVMTHFVPVNDTSVHSQPAKQFEMLLEAEATLAEAESAVATAAPGAEETRVTKAADKARARLAKARADLVSRSIATAAPGSKGGTDEAAMELLPGHRNLQPRSFPSVAPADDVVWLTWPGATPTATEVEGLTSVAGAVARVGHSSSLVSISVHPRGPDEATLVPDDGGPYLLRVPGPGQLEALEQAFERHQEQAPRVLPALHQAYAEPHEPQEAIPQSVFGDDWIVLARAAGPRLPSRRTADIAEAVRGALMHHAADPVPSIVSGRTTAGDPDPRPHLAYVPLCFIGAPHADGSALGVALVLPRDASDAERRQVSLALAAWERASRTEDQEVPELDLRLGTHGVLRLKRLEGVPALRTLRPSTWCGPARRWATATPIALDRNPGHLRHRDPLQAGEAAGRAEAIIAQAAENVGLPRPEVRVVPAPPLVGAWRAHKFPSFPKSPEKVQRVLAHAVLEFPEPIAGPVLLGAGRYRGLGLCRPLREGQ